MKFLVIDFSNISVRAFFALMGKNRSVFFDNPENVFKLKHSIIFTIIQLKKKFNIPMKNIILAIDSKVYWRKKYFQYYKCRRKMKKLSDDIDWKEFYAVQNELLEELDNNFDFKVIKQKWCEGDDVVYHISKHLSKYYKVVIASRDKDLKQILKYDNIELYDFQKKKFVKVNKKDIKLMNMVMILDGDKGDDIPNFLSDDDVYYEKSKKSKRLGVKKAEKIIQEGILSDYLKDVEYRKKIERNKRMIDLECVPKKLVEKILKKYEDSLEKKVSDDDMINYLKENKMVNIMRELKIDLGDRKLKNLMKKSLLGRNNSVKR